MPLPGTRVVAPARAASIAGVTDVTKPDVATVERRTFTKSAGGGDQTTYVVVAKDIPVRISVQGRRAIESQAGGRTEEASRWELSFPTKPEIRPITDRVRVGVRLFEVMEDGVQSYDSEVRALCVEVRS